MHIAFVLPRFYPYRGGYENSLLGIGKHLVGRGHRVTVFTTVADDLEAFWLPGLKTFPEEQISIDGVTVLRFPICYKILRRRATRLLGIVPYWKWRAQFWRPSFRIPGLQEALRAVDADLFHLGPLPYTNLMYAGLQAAEARGVPVVATPCVHLGEEGNDDVVRHYLQPYQIKVLQRCAKIFCMTGTEVRILERLGITVDKAVLPHGINMQLATGGDPQYLRRSYNVDGPVVMQLAVKTFEKGSLTLLEAMKILWARGSQAWLVMAGPTMSDFERYIAENPVVDSRFLNLRAFADQEKRGLLASATVVAQPSRVESLGLVMIEAWANAKPVIAADIAVSRELVTESGGGVVVPFGDPKALANAIERLLADSDLRRTMGLGGKKKALEYDGPKLRQQTAEEMERVVEMAKR
jgi:glycosyltransferase involved in cell wall biosynthesis